MPESGTAAAQAQDALAWPDAIHRMRKGAGIRHAAYVPDAGHSRLIELCLADPAMYATVLTTAKEAIAYWPSPGWAAIGDPFALAACDGSYLKHRFREALLGADGIA